MNQEVQHKERRKRWGWRGFAFAISLRKTKVTRTIRKKSPYEKMELQPVRIMAMTPPPPQAQAMPDDGTSEVVMTENSSIIFQVGPLDATPPEPWIIPPGK